MSDGPGTVGQIYENRRTHQIGVLESREEKYKTLLMRGESGESFNINYSTFRSTWRKYSGDKVIQTSSQVTKAEEEKNEKVKKAESVVKAEKPQMTSEERGKFISSAKEVVQNTVSEYDDTLAVKMKSKGGIVVKDGRSSIFEVWPKHKKGTYEFAISESLWDAVELSDRTGDVEGKKYETWTLKISVRDLDYDRMLSLVSDLVLANVKMKGEE